jgi:hypothetical protein
LALNTAGEPFPLRRAVNGEIKMNAPATKLQSAENDLKQLMADVTRAMGKAQEAVARIAPKVGAATTETGDNSCVAEAPGARAAAA